jgi:hypothetical protein
MRYDATISTLSSERIKDISELFDEIALGSSG